MKVEEIVKTIEELNSQYYFNGCMEHLLPFTFEYGGWHLGIVKFMGEVIWSEDNDERDFDEEKDEWESLYGFLLKEAEKIVKDLGKRSHNVNVDIIKQYNDFLDLNIEDKDIDEFLSGYYE